MKNAAVRKTSLVIEKINLLLAVGIVLLGNEEVVNLLHQNNRKLSAAMLQGYTRKLKSKELTHAGVTMNHA